MRSPKVGDYVYYHHLRLAGKCLGLGIITSINANGNVFRIKNVEGWEPPFFNPYTLGPRTIDQFELIGNTKLIRLLYG